MPYNQDHYKFNNQGNYSSQEEVERAEGNGHLEKTTTGYWDRETGEEFWPDGTKK